MLSLEYKKIKLKFRYLLQTPLGEMDDKEIWILKLRNLEIGKFGIGECSFIPGISVDNPNVYKKKIQWLCAHINDEENIIRNYLKKFPSILFGWETALKDLNSNNHLLYPSKFTDGRSKLKINAIIWHYDKELIFRQIENHIENDFKCFKIKINPQNISNVLDTLSQINNKYTNNSFKFRVDANGSFKYEEILALIDKMQEFNIHSIEQPIPVEDIEYMAKLCQESSLPIALDEQLIGYATIKEKEELLKEIKPQYIVLKPGMLGGIKECEEWINIAEKLNMSWWITSALESNIGLNVIAQWVFTLNNMQYHGLGTSHLLENNFISPLIVKNGGLWYDKSIKWDKRFA